jgi:putative transposase
MGGKRGFDGGKRVKGRKRHIAVDSLGLLLGVSVTVANTHDTKGARNVVRRVSGWLGSKAPRKYYADKGYTGANFASYVREVADADVRIGENYTTTIRSFVPDKKGWRVERTFAWLGDYRRLDKDQERLMKNSVAMIRWAMVRLMLRRLSPETIVQAA